MNNHTNQTLFAVFHCGILYMK